MIFFGLAVNLSRIPFSVEKWEGIQETDFIVTKQFVVRPYDRTAHQITKKPKMDKEEFTEIIMPLKNRLYRLAKRILISGDEAEDAVQEVLYKLWKGKEKMAEYRSPEAYALTMTKNYCLDRLKSKQASNLKIVHSNYPTSEDIEKNIDTNDGVALVFKIMETLPEQQRIVLQLRDVEQLEFSEIAKILDSNETAIRVGLSRARKTVREAMIKKYNYGIG